MLEQQPLKDLRHLFTQGQELREGKKRKEATGGCWWRAGTGGRFLTHQATVAADWMESDGWDMHMESRCSSAAQH